MANKILELGDCIKTKGGMITIDRYIYPFIIGTKDMTAHIKLLEVQADTSYYLGAQDTLEKVKHIPIIGRLLVKYIVR